MAKNKSASSKKSKPEVKAEPITILALKRPARPSVVNDDAADVAPISHPQLSQARQELMAVAKSHKF